MKVDVYNDAGEPLGFDYIYEPDPSDYTDDWYDEEDDREIYRFPWSVGYDKDNYDEEEE